jgi:hypothetical protein
MNAPAVRAEDFLSGVLGLNAVQRGQYFPNPDPTGLLEIAVSHLTLKRENILQEECSIPSYAVYKDGQNNHQIAGFDTYLATKNVDAVIRGRLARHRTIRNALRRLQDGHYLEALAAAIMNAECEFGEATRGSGDQGIDAIGWKQLVLIEPSFSDGDIRPNEVLPGEKVFLFASSKAFTVRRRNPRVINPAHIRELVGGWVIQRSSVGKWRSVGIRMLTPVQMILVTTYRLSLDAKSECRELGVQVWGIPELIYLICISAPDTVFDPAANHAFSTAGFNAWWRMRDQNRLMAV